MERVGLLFHRGMTGLLGGVMQAALVAWAPDWARSWAVDRLGAWSHVHGVRYGVASDLQAPFARVLGGRVCDFCGWAVLPGERHGSCDWALGIIETSSKARCVCFSCGAEVPLGEVCGACGRYIGDYFEKALQVCLTDGSAWYVDSRPVEIVAAWET